MFSDRKRIMKSYPLVKVDPADTAMELKCSCAATVLGYIDASYSVEKKEQLVFESGMNLEYLEDARNWISYAYFNRLLKAMVDLSGNPRAAFDAGRQYTNIDSYGNMARFLIHLLTPGATYNLMVRHNSLWNKIGEWEMLSFRRGECVIRNSNYSKYKQEKLNCLCIQGGLEAIPRIFGLPFAQVEELECACDGHPACVYRIKWVQMPELLMGIIGLTAGLVLGVVIAEMTGWSQAALPFMFILAVAGYLAGRSWECNKKMRQVYRQNEEQAQSMLKLLRDVEELNKVLQDKVEQRTAELKKTMEDLKLSQAKVLITEKQSAVGVLAAGMAHEFNNPLNAICLSTQSLKEDVGDDGVLKSQLEIIERASGRCRRIVNDLLSYSREPRMQMDVYLEEIVKSSVDLFCEEHPGGIEIRTTMAGELPVVRLDRLQIQQVILNLLKNASDSMNDRGFVEVSLYGEAKNIVLEVKDHGQGMSESLCEKIFDPFFTTKQTGKGLGLSIVYQLIARNGGTIDVASREGEGSTFTITFPVPGRESGV